jgi:urease accessory protein
MKRRSAFAALALALCAKPAEAHLMSTGMGPVYDGLLHFITSPEDAVPALALALLAGMRGSAFGRCAALVVPSAWLLGSLAGISAAAMTASPLLSSFWLLLLGGLVLADARLPLAIMTTLAGLFGVAHGYPNGTGVSLSLPALLTLVSLAAAVFVLTCLVAAFVVELRQHWARIAVRVAGSWIAASGIFMLGWAMR